MNTNQSHVLVSNGQRIDSQVFESKEAADAAAKKINETLTQVQPDDPPRLVESKQILFG